MKKKNKNSLRKLVKSKEREKRVDQGYYDGRFSPRVEKTKKSYNRKTKHKGKDLNDN
jgi:hypothetical protein